MRGQMEAPDLGRCCISPGGASLRGIRFVAPHAIAGGPTRVPRAKPWFGPTRPWSRSDYPFFSLPGRRGIRTVQVTTRRSAMGCTPTNSYEESQMAHSKEAKQGAEAQKHPTDAIRMQCVRARSRRALAGLVAS